MRYCSTCGSTPNGHSGCPDCLPPAFSRKRRRAAAHAVRRVRQTLNAEAGLRLTANYGFRSTPVRRRRMTVSYCESEDEREYRDDDDFDEDEDDDEDEDEDEDDNDDDDDIDDIDTAIPRAGDTHKITDLDIDLQVQRSGTLLATTRPSPEMPGTDMHRGLSRFDESTGMVADSRKYPFTEFARRQERVASARTFGQFMHSDRSHLLQKSGKLFAPATSRTLCDEPDTADNVNESLAPTRQPANSRTVSVPRHVSMHGTRADIYGQRGFDPVDMWGDSRGWRGTGHQPVDVPDRGQADDLKNAVLASRGRSISQLSTAKQVESRAMASVATVTQRSNGARIFGLEDRMTSLAAPCTVQQSHEVPFTSDGVARVGGIPRAVETPDSQEVFAQPMEHGNWQCQRDETTALDCTDYQNEFGALDGIISAFPDIFPLATSQRNRQIPAHDSGEPPLQETLRPGERNQDSSCMSPMSLDEAVYQIPSNESNTQAPGKDHAGRPKLRKAARERVNSWPSRGALLGRQILKLSARYGEEMDDTYPSVAKEMGNSDDPQIGYTDGKIRKGISDQTSAIHSPVSNSAFRIIPDGGRLAQTDGNIDSGGERNKATMPHGEERIEKQTEKFVVKATCRYGWQGSVHVITAGYGLQFAGFHRLLREAFEMPVDFRICYFDDDGDPVTVSSDVEMDIMLDFVRGHSNRLRVKMAPPHGILNK